MTFTAISASGDSRIIQRAPDSRANSPLEQVAIGIADAFRLPHPRAWPLAVFRRGVELARDGRIDDGDVVAFKTAPCRIVMISRVPRREQHTAVLRAIEAGATTFTLCSNWCIAMICPFTPMYEGVGLFCPIEKAVDVDSLKALRTDFRALARILMRAVESGMPMDVKLKFANIGLHLLSWSPDSFGVTINRGDTAWARDHHCSLLRGRDATLFFLMACL